MMIIMMQKRISIIAKIVSGKDLPSMDRSLFKRAKSDPYVQLWYRDVSAAVREDAAAAGAAAAQEGAASGGRNGSWRARRRFGRRNSSNGDKKKGKEKSSRLSMTIGHDAAVELRENIAKAAAASDASDLFSGAEASAMSGAEELGMPWSGKKEERASMVRKRPVYFYSILWGTLGMYVHIIKRRRHSRFKSFRCVLPLPPGATHERSTPPPAKCLRDGWRDQAAHARCTFQLRERRSRCQRRHQ